MNKRDYKNFKKGNYYHVFNRGNNKANIFYDENDYNLFIFRLKEGLFPDSQKAQTGKEYRPYYVRKAIPSGAFSLISYCLMPNHFHFLIRQNTDLPISTIMAKICTSYSMCFNGKYERVGHVFQNQFQAVPVGTNEYLLWLSAYIHANPSVAGLVKNLEDWQWSSYLEYVENKKGITSGTDIIKDQFIPIEDYKKFVFESVGIIRKKKEIEALLLD
jgi:REP element-mobilizing transposase RayT